MTVLALVASLAAPLTLAPAQIGFAELGADAQRVLFTDATAPGVYELFGTVPDGTAPPVKLNAPLVAGGIVIAAGLSPLGDRAVYVADQDLNDVFELYGVPSAGGTPVKLHPPFGGQRSVRQLGLRWFALTSDGARVVYAAGNGVRNELFSAPLDGSTAPANLSAPLVSGGSVTAYELSPDGTKVVFVADADVNGQFEALVAPVDGSAPRAVLSSLGGNVQRAGIDRASARVVYTAPEVYSVPIDGSASPIQLGTETGVYDWRFTPERVVYRNSSRLVSARLDGSSPGIVLSSSLSGAFDVSADGVWTVFVADGLLHQQLRSARTDGSTPSKVLCFDDISNCRLSPDGRRVAFTRGTNLNSLSAVDVEGLEPIRFLSGGQITSFRFVPDRERVVFTVDTFFPTQPQLFHAPASGAEPAFPLGPGRILALGAGRAKRGVSVLPPARGKGAGLLLFAAPVTGGEGLFAQPWDASEPPVRLDA